MGIISLIGFAGMMGLAINDSIVIVSECQIGLEYSVSIEQSVFVATRHVFAGGVTGATIIALCFTPACFELVKPNQLRTTIR